MLFSPLREPLPSITKSIAKGLGAEKSCLWAFNYPRADVQQAKDQGRVTGIGTSMEAYAGEGAYISQPGRLDGLHGKSRRLDAPAGLLPAGYPDLLRFDTELQGSPWVKAGIDSALFMPFGKLLNKPANEIQRQLQDLGQGLGFTKVKADRPAGSTEGS